ncbi:hypothetical protein L6R52_35920, partial [Myxococcota bacterium]|nr:hypothetical protein [Myxococcota bacterium]
MTSIDRQRFVRDLSSTPLSVRALPPPVAEALTRAGLTADDLASIAGSDHVIHGRAEAEQLYDRLVAHAARAPRPDARIDHALALLDAPRASSPTP